MTFNDDTRLQGGKVKRRGRTTAIGGGAVGVTAIVVFVALMLPRARRRGRRAGGPATFTGKLKS